MQDLCTSKGLADQKVPKYGFVFLLVVWYEQYTWKFPDMTTQSFIRCCILLLEEVFLFGSFWIMAEPLSLQQNS